MRRIAFTTLILAMLGPSGCGGDGGSPTQPAVTATSSAFSGTFLNGTESGRISFTIQSASLARAPGASQDSIPASGSATFSDQSIIALDGIYSARSDTLVLSGTGYEFIGQLEPGAQAPEIAGSYTGAGGAGAFEALAGAPGKVDIYCGSFQSALRLDTGRWNLILGGGRAVALMLFDGTTAPRRLRGTVSGQTNPLSIEMAYADTTGLAIETSGSVDLVLLHASGSWSSSQGGVNDDHGDWDATSCLAAP